MNVGDVLRGFLLGALIVLVLPSPSQAHDPYVWFDPLAWDNYTDVNYQIDDSIPGDNGSNFETRIHDGVADWNAVTGVGGFTFDDVGNGNKSWGDPCNWQDAATDIWVFYHDITSVGQTKWCEVWHNQQQYWDIQSARVAFDTDPTWYRGTGNVPSGEISVWEASTHEFGHATGTFRGGNYGGHWPPEPSTQCALGGAESDWTMCPVTTPGEDYLIPLEPHDIDTFQSFY